MRITAEDVYDMLVNRDQILTLRGQIKFFLGDINIIVKQKDVVGNIMQEWLQGWMDNNGIDYAPSDNPQMPPDFYLDPDDRTSNLLEVKAFNYNAQPGFDIAAFNAFYREIVLRPYMLHAKYLIFGYRMSPVTGEVVIKRVWLKNIWEICRPMQNWALNLQVKQGVVHKIRPANWYSTARTRFSCFNSLEDLLSAIEEVVYQNPDTHNDAASWKREMIHSYERFYGTRLNIQRWDDIRETYIHD